MQRIVVTGTDTDIGKTVFCAALLAGLEVSGYEPRYWKPVQSGIAEGTDTYTAMRLSGLAEARFMSERYVFTAPLSPHRAAELDDRWIDMADLCDLGSVPACDGILVIEGAGGLMVPFTRQDLQIDLYKSWQIPVVLCCRTSLGTINHTLLSIEALKVRNIPILGLVFIGEDNPDNVKTIADFSNIKVLGVMPHLESLTSLSLAQMFAQNFKAKDFVL
ncbi:MAG: dethiobiotin synthase [Alphaproteobacteria bacterium]